MEAYQIAERLAHQIFLLCKTFPKNEERRLIDQVVRSSRSVCSNLAESYAKRRYPKHFTAKLTDALGENYETQTWIRFARRCKYIEDEAFEDLIAKNSSVGRLITTMIRHPKRYADKYV